MHNSRLSKIARKPVSAGAIVLAVLSATTQMVALAAVTGLSTSPSRTIHQQQLQASAAAARVEEAAGQRIAGTVDRVIIPTGGSQCPNSAPGAACGSASQPAVEAGAASLPDGQTECPAVAGKPVIGGPAACAEAPAPLSPSQAAAASVVGSRAPAMTVDLITSQTTVVSQYPTLLIATASASVTGTPWAIEIFDLTTGALVAACPQSNTCSVYYKTSARVHTFAAYVTTPTTSVPASGYEARSHSVNVRWLGISLAPSGLAVNGPGRPVTFTATTTEDVGPLGYIIEIYDISAGVRVSYCAQGMTCSTSLVVPDAGVHTIVAALTATQAHGQVIHTDSNHVDATWLAVQLSSGGALGDGTVWLTATANADLSATPWSIAIQDDQGKAIGNPCHAATCTERAAMPSGRTPSFTAVIQGTAATATSGARSGGAAKSDRTGVLAQSTAVTPGRLLWGVDSCKNFTGDANASSGVYPAVVSRFGNRPDFWGRYLTDTYNCPRLNQTEITAAHNLHMGILPIYDDYDCSAVSGYQVAGAYAKAAAATAAADGIPQGTGIAIDIEPAGPQCPGADGVDSMFVLGWHDGLVERGYVPIYYGNTTAYLAFAQAWCGAIVLQPTITRTSYLWSFEPSLEGTYTRASAPAFAPNDVGCGGKRSAWQYELSTPSSPDVDQDEVTADLPLWYP